MKPLQSSLLLNKDLGRLESTLASFQLQYHFEGKNHVYVRFRIFCCEGIPIKQLCRLNVLSVKVLFCRPERLINFMSLEFTVPKRKRKCRTKNPVKNS